MNCVFYSEGMTERLKVANCKFVGLPGVGSNPTSFNIIVVNFLFKRTNLLKNQNIFYRL